MPVFSLLILVLNLNLPLRGTFPTLFFLPSSISFPHSNNLTSSSPMSTLTQTDHSADVAANLKGKVPKPMAQKIMITLAGKSANESSGPGS